MSEILFRGKRIDNSEWVEGYYQLCGHLVGTIEEDIYTTITPFTQRGHIVDPKTVGQFTGLTDKNGTKIFVGDVIKTDNGKQKAISVVKYGNFRPKMIYHMFRNYIGYEPKQDQHGVYCETANEQMVLFDSPTCIEVIGNIHDNPELLGGGG